MCRMCRGLVCECAILIIAAQRPLQYSCWMSLRSPHEPRTLFRPDVYARTTGLSGNEDKRCCMVSNISTVLSFIVALIISTVIIYYIAKFFGAKDSLTTAVLAALIGTAVYTIFYYVLGQGLLPAFIAGIVWLLALQKLYTIGWLRALVIAIVIWIVTSIAGWYLPVL